MHHALVYPWGVGCLLAGVSPKNEADIEPVGVIEYAPGTFNQYGIVLNLWTMLDPTRNECCFKQITEAEYETHLEFGTYRKLRRRLLWGKAIRERIWQLKWRLGLNLDPFEWACLATLVSALVGILAVAFDW